MSYCDKDCQAEHWNKVHRFHCKFLSGEKPVAGTKHSSGKRNAKCARQRRRPRK